MARWYIRKNWCRGEVVRHVMRLPVVRGSKLERGPYPSTTRNAWFVRTVWWRHRRGWQVQTQRLMHWLFPPPYVKPRSRVAPVAGVLVSLVAVCVLCILACRS